MRKPGTELYKEGVGTMEMLSGERAATGASVARITERLQAEVLCCSESLDGVVENLMIAAMTVDSGLDYFSRKDNKAVIVRGERPDCQLAALATSTRCLVLTGGVRPPVQVLSLAEEKGVPVLLTDRDTLSVVAEMEQLFVPGG